MIINYDTQNMKCIYTTYNYNTANFIFGLIDKYKYSLFNNSSKCLSSEPISRNLFCVTLIKFRQGVQLCPELHGLYDVFMCIATGDKVRNYTLY